MFSKEGVMRVIKSLGLVFGDIGTSPIYTLTVIFIFLQPTITHIMGVLSLIVWTLILLVTVGYTWLAMSLGKRGEGGTIVLKEILAPLLKSGRRVAVVAIVVYLGVSLLVGDGVITPAISILSAVEGLKLIPMFSGVSQTIIVVISCLIAIGLFSIQKRGTEKISKLFGPVMVLWFIALGLSGLVSIIHYPVVLLAISPMFALNFLFSHGMVGFFVLSEVILCATGVEALYADMGHLGRKPIIQAWGFVFVALILTYLGQGAYVAQNTTAVNILFEMVFNEAPWLYIPFLFLSILATIIASQALISGLFSVVYQGIMTRILPMFKVDYTSPTIRSQIYIGAVNMFLMIFVLIAIVFFRESANLAAAYGLAVTGTITLTGILMTTIFYLKQNYIKAVVAGLVTGIDSLFLMSCMLKIPHGGYWSLIIASLPLITILVYTEGQRKLYKALKPLSLEDFLLQYRKAYQEANAIKGSALFFVRSPQFIPPYIVNTMFNNHIIYRTNILLSINVMDKPFGTIGEFKDDIAGGLRYFEIRIGYMEVMDIEALISRAGIHENVIFYGLEDIVTEKSIWKIFAFIKKVTPSFVQFYTLPSHRLHGIITRVEL